MSDKQHPVYADEFEKEVHLSDYLHVVLRRWKIVLLVFLLVFLGVAVKTFSTTPIYEAYATLEVDSSKKGNMLDSLASGSSSYYNDLSNEIEVLQSRSLAETVARRLNLDWLVTEKSDGLDLAVTEFVPGDALHGLTITLIDGGNYQVADLSGQVLGRGQSGVPLRLDGLKLLITFKTGQAGQSLVFEREPLADTAEGLVGSLTVSEVEDSGKVLRVAYQGANPVQARNIVNALTDAYRERKVTGKAQEAGMTVDFISQQLSGLKQVLDKSEQQLQEYKVQTGLVTLGPEGNSLVQKLVELDQRKAELGLKRQRVESAISTLKEAIRSGKLQTVPTIEDAPAIAAAAAKLSDLEAQKNSLLIDYTAAHPAVEEVQTQINQGRASMLSTYQTMREELVAAERDLAKTISGYDAQLKDVPETELELAKRMRVNQVNAELYTFLLQKQQEARIAQASTISNVQIIDPALTPQFPVKPNKRKNLALGFILGLMLGVGLAFLLEYMDQTIKTTEDVQEKLGLNVFGIIPRIPFADEDAELPSKRLVTNLAPHSPTIEAFRALRTNLNYLTAKEKHKVILITSSLPSEGKSTVAGNLAVVLSQTGSRVLLVGCDLRRPSLFEMFDQPNVPGLVDMLIHDTRGALRQMASPRLDLMSAGSIPPNPAELLDSDRFRKFITIVRQRYDYVVLDAPPVLPVTDAQILSPMVDINLVVLEPCRVPEKAAKQMVETLRAVDAKISGVILNDKTGRGFKYYGNYGYYGNKFYRAYYGEGKIEEKDGAMVAGLKKVWGKLNS